MEAANNLKHALVNVDDCVLLVIDVQDYFLDKLTQPQRDKLISRIGWVMEIAKILQVPIIATAEEMPRCGSLTRSLAEKLPPTAPIYNKMIFALADNPDILAAVQATGRHTAVLVGMETDVCVAQSAIGLIGAGFQVVALADATISPGDAHEFGLERMRGAGVLLMLAKSLYYEWIRTVAMSNQIPEEHFDRIGVPLGMTL